MKLIVGATAVAAIIFAAIWINKAPPTFDGPAVVEEAGDLERRTEVTGDERDTHGVPEAGSMADAKSRPNTQEETTFEKIRAEAERGSVVAQRQLSEIYGFCMPYSLNPTTQLRTLDALATPESTTSMDQVKVRLVARCDRVDSGQPIPFEAITLWSEQAAKNGDVASIVQNRVMSLEPLTAEEATGLADAVLASRDPQALMEMFDLMMRPIAEEMPDRYKRLAGNPLAGAAWGIAACRAGATCHSGSMMMDSLCISTGSCNYRSFEEFVFAEMVPPAQRKRVIAMANEILGNP